MTTINYQNVVAVAVDHSYADSVRVTGVGIEEGPDMIVVGPTYHRPGIENHSHKRVVLDAYTAACGTDLPGGIILRAKYVTGNSAFRACKKWECFGATAR